MSEQTSLKLVSTALTTAQAYSESNENVKKALELLVSSYLTVSSTSKNVLPLAFASKITDLENYVAAVDKTAIVASLDGHADSVYTLTDAALKAKKVRRI